MTRVPSGWPITEDVLATGKAVERSGNRRGNGWEWTERDFLSYSTAAHGIEADPQGQVASRLAY